MSDSEQPARDDREGRDRPARRGSRPGDDAGRSRDGRPRRDDGGSARGDASRSDRSNPRRDGGRGDERGGYRGGASRDDRGRASGGSARSSDAPRGPGERPGRSGGSRDGGYDRRPVSRDGQQQRSYGNGGTERPSSPRSDRGGEGGRRFSSNDGPRAGDKRPSYGNRGSRDGDRRPYAPRSGDSTRADRPTYGSNSDRPRRDAAQGRDGRDGSERRTPRDGERRPYRADERSNAGGERRFGRPDRDVRHPAERGDRERSWDRGGRDDRGFRDERGGRDERPRKPEPVIPDGVEAKHLDRVARNELKTLTAENAERVAQHLVMAARLIESDSALALQHAAAAADRAGRIGVARETYAIVAYAAGEYALALRELRTYRRITGRDDELAMMIDSERALGRPEKALELGRSVPRSSLEVPVQVEVAIAMSGARLDLGQPEDALGELRIPQLDPNTAFEYSADLFAAYATVLEELGREAEAADWWRRADLAAEAFDDSASDLIEIVEEDVEFVDEDTDSFDDGAEDSLREDDAPADDRATGSTVDDADADAESDVDADADTDARSQSDGSISDDVDGLAGADHIDRADAIDTADAIDRAEAADAAGAHDVDALDVAGVGAVSADADDDEAVAGVADWDAEDEVAELLGETGTAAASETGAASAPAAAEAETAEQGAEAEPATESKRKKSSSTSKAAQASAAEPKAAKEKAAKEKAAKEKTPKEKTKSTKAKSKKAEPGAETGTGDEGDAHA